MTDAPFNDAATQRLEIVETLVAIRKAYGLSQKDVAERMGVKSTAVSRFETEGRDARLSTVQRYARALGCRVDVDVYPDVKGAER